MDITQIQKIFNFEKTPTIESLYPYAPVYKITHENQSNVLKKTCPSWCAALVLSRFTKRLNDRKIPIVSPIELPKNPIMMQDDIWVAYPYISGFKYSGEDSEIIAAGRLLGQIHALSSDNNQEGLEEYDEFNLEKKEIMVDFEEIKS